MTPTPHQHVAWIERSDTQGADSRVSLRSTRATVERTTGGGARFRIRIYQHVAWVERSDTQGADSRVSLRSTRATVERAIEGQATISNFTY